MCFIIIDNGIFFSSLEMLDKIEPPLIPDGYGLSLAFLCMLNVVKCVHSLIEATAIKGRQSAQAGAQAGAKTSVEGVASESQSAGQEQGERLKNVDHCGW